MKSQLIGNTAVDDLIPAAQRIEREIMASLTLPNTEHFYLDWKGEIIFHTSCTPQEVAATMAEQLGVTANLSTHSRGVVRFNVPTDHPLWCWCIEVRRSRRR